MSRSHYHCFSRVHFTLKFPSAFGTDKPWQCLSWKNNYHVFFFLPVKVKRSFKDGYTLEYSLGKISWAFTKWRSLELHKATDVVHGPSFQPPLRLFFVPVVLIIINIKAVHLLILKKFLLRGPSPMQTLDLHISKAGKQKACSLLCEREERRKWGEEVKEGWQKGAYNMSQKICYFVLAWFQPEAELVCPYKHIH